MPRNIAAFFPPPTDAGTLSLLLYYNSRRKANEIENIPQIRHLFFTCARGFGATMSQERRRSCATSARGTLPSSRTLIQYRLFMWYPGATPAYVSHSICDSAGSHFTFRANSLPSPPPNVRRGTQKQMPNHLRLSLRRSTAMSGSLSKDDRTGRSRTRPPCAATLPFRSVFPYVCTPFCHYTPSFRNNQRIRANSRTYEKSETSVDFLIIVC